MPENKCQREGCKRLRWNLEKPYCSSSCHLVAMMLRDSQDAVIDNPHSNTACEWYAASVALADAINEVSRLKNEFRKEKARNYA